MKVKDLPGLDEVIFLDAQPGEIYSCWAVSVSCGGSIKTANIGKLTVHGTFSGQAIPVFRAYRYEKTSYRDFWHIDHNLA